MAKRIVDKTVRAGGWDVSHHKGDVFRLSRRSRVIFVKVRNGKIVQCDRTGSVSPTFINALTGEHQDNVLRAIRENFQIDT